MIWRIELSVDMRNDKVKDFSEFAYACTPSIASLSAVSFEDGTFATVVNHWENYSPVEGDVFIDSDGDDIWTMIDGNWVIFDPMTCKINESDESWESLNLNYGPVHLLTEYIIY